MQAILMLTFFVIYDWAKDMHTVKLLINAPSIY